MSTLMGAFLMVNSNGTTKFPIMEEIEQYIEDWIRKVSILRPELGNNAICPFAFKSNYKIICCNAKDIVVDHQYDVIIYVIESDFSLEKVQEWVDHHNKLSKDWSFFEDCATYDTFINGIQTNNGKYNLIIGQPIKKLRNFRKKLLKTSYYSYWDKEYLKEILQKDYDLLSERDSNPVKSSDSKKSGENNGSKDVKRDH